MSRAAGILLANEQDVLQSMSCAKESANLYFVPLIWAANLVNRARKEGHIKDDFSVKTLIDVSCSPYLTLPYLTLPAGWADAQR